MTDDLIRLARQYHVPAGAHYANCEADHLFCLLLRMADEIERLQTVAQEQRHAADAYATECKELRDWQRRAVNISAPFAAWDLPHMASFEDDRPIFAIDGRTVTIGDVRRLRALIEEAGHE